MWVSIDTIDMKRNEIHNKLLTDIATEWIVGKDLTKFQMNSWLYLTTPAQKKIKDVPGICIELEHNGLLGPGSYEVLRKLVYGLHVEITNLIDKADQEIKSLDTQYGIQVDPCNGVL